MVSTLLCPSLAPSVDLLSACTPAQLISGEQFRYIRAIAQFLPGAMTCFFGLESPLGTTDARGDFLVCTTTEDRGAEILADRHPHIYLPESLKAHPVWKQVQQFGQSWCEVGSPLNQRIQNVWLEFDVEGMPDAIPVPSCFFGPGAVYPEPSAAGAAYDWITRQGLQCLRHQAIPAAIEGRLFQCLDQLPASAYVFQIGTMLARQTDTVRLCIRDIAPDQVGDYLKRLDWVGSVAEVELWLKELSALTERVDIDLDVGETIEPRIGLECYLEKQPKFEPRWEVFLNYLVSQGLCVPEKKQGLLLYPGCVRKKHYQQVWPQHLNQLSQVLGEEYEILFFKGLHHIKVVYQSGVEPVAKAYLSVRQAVVEKEGIKQLLTQVGHLIRG